MLARGIDRVATEWTLQGRPNLCRGPPHHQNGLIIICGNTIVVSRNGLNCGFTQACAIIGRESFDQL